MTGDPQAPGLEAERPCTVILSRQARRNLHENLPLDVAAAAMETIDRPLTTNPHRVGKPLDEPSDGYHSARRGTYRIIYRINEDKHTVQIHSIRHRRDSYRALPGNRRGTRIASPEPASGGFVVVAARGH
ncbi:MAG: type II toxin-antitoxin system RelE/ParE family toxin [Streptosporangiaceae bacterium]|jgi:mRNA interferase RelE/StbE